MYSALTTKLAHEVFRNYCNQSLFFSDNQKLFDADSYENACFIQSSSDEDENQLLQVVRVNKPCLHILQKLHAHQPAVDIDSVDSDDDLIVSMAATIRSF
ncbi:hypothetical protein T08_5353 [Trichinella sp. T8]|nr:hypothetical protein T08_5353 [Trichinella sp. T8]